MGEKKNKALERELLDDLLEDHGDSTDALNDAEPEAEKKSQVINSPRDQLDLDTKNLTLELDLANDKTDVSEQPQEPSRSKSKSKSKTAETTVQVENDPTVRLNDNTNASKSGTAPNHSEVEDQVRSSVGRFGNFRNTSTPTGAALAQSENLRIAQTRILELEREVERLRVENEELAAAGETFRRKADELTSKADDLDNRYQNAVSTHSQEKELLVGSRDSIRHDLEKLKVRNEELESRISTNIQKIRVRERELENRLELVKMEGSALIRSKDEIILDLKRQIDQLSLELNNYRTKSQELNRMILDKQDILRRTVKALRLALTMLEGDEETAQPVKKAK